MKPIKLYKVEVGVLLKKEHQDYEVYAQVYDKQHAYYDENVVFFRDKKNAKEYLKNYVFFGVVGTYGILSELVYNQDEIGYNDEDTQQILKDIDECGIFDDYAGVFESELYDTKNVIFTQYKKSPKVFKKIFSARKKITLANLSDMTPEDLLNNFPYTKENREYLDKIFNDIEKYDDEDYFDECYKLAEQQLKGEK
jgi:hypothetical protein